MRENLNNDSVKLAATIRKEALHMVARANASHIGSCLSMADLLAVLYSRFLRHNPVEPKWENRDRFLLSKGHAAAIVYALLAELGYFPNAWLEDYCANGSLLTGHISHHVPGVELSTGSLGHALSVGTGMALAARADGRETRVVVLVSDGELDEGSNWEAILFAGHHRLDHLTVIVDYNKIQSFGTVKEVLDLEPLADKWIAFGWAAREIDGHSHEAIADALTALPFEVGKPSVLIAHTVKGRGVDFMENQLLWHYRSPKPEELQRALAQVNCGA